MPHYFAYGSNLLTARLTHRCARARRLGKAVAQGWRVDFTKYSWMDGSGKATIERDDTASTEGVLYHLPDDDLALLDRIEGVGQGYDRIEISVIDQETTTTATTYIATEPREGLAPFDWYLGLILAGCAENALTDKTSKRFRQVPYQPDPDDHRPGKIEAIELLTKAHGPFWRKTLLP